MIRTTVSRLKRHGEIYIFDAHIINFSWEKDRGILALRFFEQKKISQIYDIFKAGVLEGFL